MHFFDIGDAIADPAIGDNLFALGYDPRMDSTARLWTGSVLSLWDEPVATVDATTGQTKMGVRTWLYTGATAVPGMSGAPVFNGCGLAGISVTTKLETLDTSLWATSVQVVHVRHLVEFLNNPKAKEYGFTVDPMEVRTCPIKMKSYCAGLEPGR
eukprot:gene18192-13065_t